VDGGHDMEVWGPGFTDGLTYMFENGLSAPTEGVE
jgi:enterochelin esterase-like enzyme